MPSLEYQKSDYLRLGEQPLSGTTLVNWIRVLRDNKFQIDWQYIPKALYVTGMILALSPFRYIERKKFDSEIQKITNVQPIFIIGHFRSGTTYLHYLMGHDPDLSFVSTFETMTPGMIIAKEELFKNLVKNHLPSKRPMDDLEMNANLPYEEEYAIANMSPYSFYHGWYFPRNLKTYFNKFVTFNHNDINHVESWKKTYDFFIKKISYKYKGKPVLLKSIVNTARIKHILDLYPDAKFIHIHRNPYTVYMSTWKLYQKILAIFSFQHINSDILDEYILYFYRELFSNYLKQKSLIPSENLIEFSYNEFVSNPIDTLKRTYNQFGLNHFDTATPHFKSYVKKHRNYKPSTYHFDEDIKQKVYRHWKFMFDAYQYEQ